MRAEVFCPVISWANFVRSFSKRRHSPFHSCKVFFSLSETAPPMENALEATRSLRRDRARNSGNPVSIPDEGRRWIFLIHKLIRRLPQFLPTFETTACTEATAACFHGWGWWEDGHSQLLGKLSSLPGSWPAALAHKQICWPAAPPWAPYQMFQSVQNHAQLPKVQGSSWVRTLLVLAKCGMEGIPQYLPNRGCVCTSHWATFMTDHVIRHGYFPEIKKVQFFPPAKVPRPAKYPFSHEERIGDCKMWGTEFFMSKNCHHQYNHPTASNFQKIKMILSVLFSSTASPQWKGSHKSFGTYWGGGNGTFFYFQKVVVAEDVITG